MYKYSIIVGLLLSTSCYALSAETDYCSFEQAESFVSMLDQPIGEREAQDQQMFLKDTLNTRLERRHTVARAERTAENARYYLELKRKMINASNDFNNVMTNILLEDSAKFFIPKCDVVGSRMDMSATDSLSEVLEAALHKFMQSQSKEN